ncbi:MAG TPA: HD domain-containing protein [bacterium]|nr:HD domain-containing protein [bacterium]
MITLSQIKKNPYILEFIKQTENVLRSSGYTEHGLEHSTLVADRARTIAKEIEISTQEQELSAIAGFCHDMGNFLSRSHHNYLGSVLFYQVFKEDFSPEEISLIMQAITFHDKEDILPEHEDIKFPSAVSAIVVLADKSDVRRSRVNSNDVNDIKKDIHDRVNYATEFSKLGINKKRKNISLTLKIDTNFVPVMEYFEIFTNRMIYCRKAAKSLGYKFGLVINKFKLL